MQDKIKKQLCKLRFDFSLNAKSTLMWSGVFATFILSALSSLIIIQSHDVLGIPHILLILLISVLSVLIVINIISSHYTDHYLSSNECINKIYKSVNNLNDDIDEIKHTLSGTLPIIMQDMKRVKNQTSKGGEAHRENR